jgi:hypothetical protein
MAVQFVIVAKSSEGEAPLGNKERQSWDRRS